MNKKMISLGIVLIGIILLVVGVFSMVNNSKKNNDDKDSGKKEIKRDYECSEVYEDDKIWTNVLDTKENYEFDSVDNRVNNSLKLSSKHELPNGLVVENAKIISYYCRDRYAILTATVTNNTSTDIVSGYLTFNFYVTDQKEDNTVVVEIENLKSNESKEIKLETAVRIINASDYTVSYSEEIEFSG